MPSKYGRGVNPLDGADPPRHEGLAGGPDAGYAVPQIVQVPLGSRRALLGPDPVPERGDGLAQLGLQSVVIRGERPHERPAAAVVAPAQRVHEPAALRGLGQVDRRAAGT